MGGLKLHGIEYPYHGRDLDVSAIKINSFEKFDSGDVEPRWVCVAVPGRDPAWEVFPGPSDDSKTISESDPSLQSSSAPVPPSIDGFPGPVTVKTEDKRPQVTVVEPVNLPQA